LRILITNDFGMQYDEALDILRDGVAWEYGGMTNNAPDFIKGPYNAAVIWLE